MFRFGLIVCFLWMVLACSGGTSSETENIILPLSNADTLFVEMAVVPLEASFDVEPKVIAKLNRSFDLSSLEPGSYLASFKSEDGTVVTKEFSINKEKEFEGLADFKITPDKESLVKAKISLLSSGQKAKGSFFLNAAPHELSTTKYSEIELDLEKKVEYFILWKDLEENYFLSETFVLQKDSTFEILEWESLSQKDVYKDLPQRSKELSIYLSSDTGSCSEISSNSQVLDTLNESLLQFIRPTIANAPFAGEITWGTETVWAVDSIVALSVSNSTQEAFLTKDSNNGGTGFSLSYSSPLDADSPYVVQVENLYDWVQPDSQDLFEEVCLSIEFRGTESFSLRYFVYGPESGEYEMYVGGLGASEDFVENTICLGEHLAVATTWEGQTYKKPINAIHLVFPLGDQTFEIKDLRQIWKLKEPVLLSL